MAELPPAIEHSFSEQLWHGQGGATAGKQASKKAQKGQKGKGSKGKGVKERHSSCIYRGMRGRSWGDAAEPGMERGRPKELKLHRKRGGLGSWRKS